MKLVSGGKKAGRRSGGAPKPTRTDMTGGTPDIGVKAVTDLFRGNTGDGAGGPVIPLPDEEELERVRRKRAARRAGGRASTVLSDDDRLGG
jgi:hypothetical protein